MPCLPQSLSSGRSLLRRYWPCCGGAVLLLLTALAFGLSSSIVMDEQGLARAGAYIGHYLQALPGADINSNSEFLRALIKNLLTGTLLGLGALHLLLLPLTALALLSKGYTLGYALSFLLSYQGDYPLAGSVMGALLPPQLLLLLLMLVWATDAAITAWRLWRAGRGFASERRRLRRGYGQRLLVYGGALLLISLAEGYLCPLLLRMQFIIH